MVIKCKPRGRAEVEEVSKQAYQTDDLSPSKVVVDTDIPSYPCSVSGEVDIIELPRQYLISQPDEASSTKNEDEDEDEDEEFDDDVEIGSDENSPQLSD